MENNVDNLKHELKSLGNKLDNLGIDIKSLTKSTQLILGNANLIKRQVKEINASQRSMLRIKAEINFKIKKIGLESIVKSAMISVANVAGAVGNTLGKAGKFALLIMAKVYITEIQDGFSDFDSPILENFSAPGVSVPDISMSDIAEEISSQIIEGGISNLIDAVADQKNILFNNLSVSNIDELKYLQLVFIELKKWIELLLIQSEWIKKIAEDCLKSKALINLIENKYNFLNLDLDQEFKKISKDVKLNFTKYNLLEDQLIDLKKSQNEIFSLQAILKNINGSLKNKNLSQITKIPIDLDLLLETLKNLITELGCYIEGVKFNNHGKLVFITKSNESNSLQNLFENWQKISIQCGTLMSANKRLEKVAENLIQEKILNEISTSSEKGILSLNTIKKEVAKISQEINQGFSLISTYLIKEKIQKIQIHQERLKNIQKKLNELLEIFMKISNNPLDIKNVKTLISKFGKNCTGLIIDTNGKESFSFNIDGFHKSFDQLNEEYETLESTIETTLEQAISKINSGQSWLRIKQRLEKIFLISFLVTTGYFAWNNSSTKFLIKQGIEKVLPQQQNNQIYSETVPQQPEVLANPQELNDQLSLTNAQKLAMEAALMSQQPPHPLEQWQQIESKWLEAIKLLETIPENSILYSQVREKLETYKSNHIAINQRIITEKTAIANLENAQKLAWEASIIVQKPPHPLEVWLKAQSKLEQAITLLKTIPKGSFVESQAQNKLETYQANYNVITQQVKNAQN